MFVSVALEHNDWLMSKLRENKGVSRIYDVSVGEPNHGIDYHVHLSDRIGRDDWENLLALPAELGKSLKAPEKE